MRSKRQLAVARCGRHKRKARGRLDLGESSVSYIAVVVLVASVVTALVTSGIGGKVSTGVGRAICSVTQDGCAGWGSDASSRRPPSPAQEEPQAAGVLTPEPTGLPVVPPQAKPQTEQALNDTVLGRDALNWLRKNDVTVVYRPGGGSKFSNSTNTIYLDTRNPPTTLAAILVHEVHHAQSLNQPNPKVETRDNFIKASIAEEIDATVLEFKTIQQLLRKRGTGVPKSKLQEDYEKIYQESIRKAIYIHERDHKPPLSDTQKIQKGEEAARAWLKQGYLSGRIVQSSDGKTYTDGYGRAWDNCSFWRVFC